MGLCGYFCILLTRLKVRVFNLCAYAPEGASAWYPWGWVSAWGSRYSVPASIGACVQAFTDRRQDHHRLWLGQGGHPWRARIPSRGQGSGHVSFRHPFVILSSSSASCVFVLFCVVLTALIPLGQDILAVKAKFGLPDTKYHVGHNVRQRPRHDRCPRPLLISTLGICIQYDICQCVYILHTHVFLDVHTCILHFCNTYNIQCMSRIQRAVSY
jgi:hypothetical protein